MTVRTLTEAANGTRVDLRVDDSIAVRLPDNPTTGYRWQLAAVDGHHLVLEDESFEVADERVGSGGTAVWVVRAVGPGSTALVAKRWRPWEGEGSVIERFFVDVVIAAREVTRRSQGRSLGSP